LIYRKIAVGLHFQFLKEIQTRNFLSVYNHVIISEYIFSDLERLTSSVRSRNVAVCVLRFGIPLNVAVYNFLVHFVWDIFVWRDHCGFYIAVHRVSGRPIRAIVRHWYLRCRYVPDIGVIILLVVSVLRLELLLWLTRIQIVIVLIELRRLLVVCGCNLRKVVLYVQWNVRRGCVHVQVGSLIARRVVENRAVRRHGRGLYGVTLRYLKQIVSVSLRFPRTVPDVRVHERIALPLLHPCSGMRVNGETL